MMMMMIYNYIYTVYDIPVSIYLFYFLPLPVLVLSLTPFGFDSISYKKSVGCGCVAILFQPHRKMPPLSSTHCTSCGNCTAFEKSITSVQPVVIVWSTRDLGCPGICFKANLARMPPRGVDNGLDLTTHSHMKPDQRSFNGKQGGNRSQNRSRSWGSAHGNFRLASSKEAP